MPVIAIQDEPGDFTFKGHAFNITEAKNEALAPFHKQVHNYGVELCILPENDKKVSAIRQQIGNARFVRNRYLNDRIQYYRDHKTTLTVAEYKKSYLPKLKEEFPFLKLSDKFALEAAIEHVDQAYRKFFQGDAGFPKFVSKYKPHGNKYTTKYTNGNIDLFIGEDGLPYVKLPKIGAVRFVLPNKKTLSDILPHGVHITSASVQERSAGRLFVSLQLESVIDEILPLKEVPSARVMAMDMGLKSFCIYGNYGRMQAIKNPRWIKLHARRLRRFQQALARKQYDQATHTGSKNYEKARRKVAKEQLKTANQRKDFQHKLSRKVADECDIFICEDLCIRGMMKNHRMAKAVASVGWGQFLEFVQYKIEAKGGRFIRVNRFYPSSQLCSVCGYQNPEVKDTKIREWICPLCQAWHDRDRNAVCNLYREGSRLLAEEGIRITWSPVKIRPAGRRIDSPRVTAACA